jgi:hypothetical protein
MRFKWYRFAVYLIVGIFCFGLWVSYNYSNYTQSTERGQAKIEKNIALIDETTKDITIEVGNLKMVQQEIEEAEEGPQRSPASIDPLKQELESRIAELEREKLELERDKFYIKSVIEDSVSVFKGIKVDNPLVNSIIIPIFLYIMKKLIDMVFVRLEEWHNRREHAV